MEFIFTGVSKYLEDLVTCINAPQLDHLEVYFFNQINFDSPQLTQFINRTPEIRACNETHVLFYDRTVYIELTYWRHEPDHIPSLIGISCREPDWQLSAIGQVCNSCLPPLSMVEDLYIEPHYGPLVWKNDAIENNLWLELLLSFTAVKNLYLFKESAPGIVAALEELVGDRITEILPSLQNILVQRLEPWEPFHEHIGQFITARQLSGHPVTISVWNEEEVGITVPSLVPHTV
jgi:hypothetical protein